MQSKRRTTALVLTGAVGVASAAYGLGTQANDGSAAADAADGRNGGRALVFEHGPPPGFSDLADRLGVDADRLGDALRDFHEQEHADRRDELAARLGGALDIPAGRVTAALDDFHERMEARMERRRGAFEDGPPPPHAGVRRLALPLRQLASSLDVTPAELRKAFREIRPERASGFDEHTDALASFLAERFDLDQGTVSDALGDLRRPAPHPRGTRPGPGGPGAFAPPL